MAKNIDIRERDDVIECLNAILNNNGIAEVKKERHEIITVVEIRRQKKIPPKDK